ncbi:hypothetical protein GCM10009867_16380 [Pedococcus aerophilus]|uniref:Uncharacterized protein n=1 Tax=Pedococcus aerophilus TaxID=436356 RepID=A0ABP6H3B4_9MICO
MVTALTVARGIAPRRATWKWGGEAHLGFDGAEVLDPVPGGAAQVGEPAVHQLGEVQCVEGGAAVVVPFGSGWDALAGADASVGVQGEGDEHRGPVRLAVRGGEHRAHRAIGDLLVRQLGHAFEAAGGAHPARSGTAVVGLVALVVIECVRVIVRLV